jgi:23S rRNA (cytidine1920-2'-O)/16S rRNA (cytidine1409-2'-O)-methyltransferase
LVRRGLFSTRSVAQRAIAEGRVVVGGLPATRPATLVDEQVALSLAREGPQWASRGGTKLAAALEAFSLDPGGRRCLDVGASTGGFTDVLLSRGAAGVAALDVGYGQLHWRLRSDSRVKVFDRTNFRTTDPAALGAPFDLITVDVSFISVRLLAANLAGCGRPGTDYVVLVKPQFEVGREQVGRGGLVTDPSRWAAAIEGVAKGLAAAGIGPIGVCPSPIPGATGNREFFLHGRHGAGPVVDQSSIQAVVSA